MASHCRYSLPSLAWATCFILTIFLCISPGLAAIKCYQCDEATSNDQCNTEEVLKECTYAAHDTCQTLVKMTEETGLSISKHCAVGPCNLGDENQYTALGLHCDKSKPTWNCASCCTEDACNFGSGQSPLVSRRELAAAMAVVVVMCHMWSLV